MNQDTWNWSPQFKELWLDKIYRDDRKPIPLDTTKPGKEVDLYLFIDNFHVGDTLTSRW